MTNITPILITLLLHSGVEEPLSFGCRDINYYQQPSTGGQVYNATPQTFIEVWSKLTGGDTLLLTGGEYGHFVVGDGRQKVSGVPSSQTTADTTTIIGADSSITVGTSTYTNWGGSVIASGFTDWVTIAADDENNPPIFSSIDIGTLYVPCPSTAEEPDDNQVNPKCIRDDGTRNTIRTILFDEDPDKEINIRFAGVVVEDGFAVSGVKNVEITNSVIKQKGDPRAHIESNGVIAYNALDVSVNCNEITNASFGVKVAAKNMDIKYNHIHHNGHDGISLNGGSNILIEGNVIHDLDDGIGDGDVVCIPGTARDGKYTLDKVELINGVYVVDKDDISTLLTENSNYGVNGDACRYLDANQGCCTTNTWNMHTDGIHMYIVGWINSKYAEDAKDVTIRSNLIYDYESMAMMVNGNSVGVYQNFTLENNVFGPAGGYLFILGAGFEESLIFRNNTILYAPENQWTSMFNREGNGQNYFVQTWSSSLDLAHYQFYNNILDANSIFSTSYTTGYNIFMGTSWQTPTSTDIKIPKDTAGLYTIEGTIQEQIDAGMNPGELIADSQAIDFGTTGASIAVLAKERANANLGTNKDGPVYIALQTAVDGLNDAMAVFTTIRATANSIQGRANCTTNERMVLDAVIDITNDVSAKKETVTTLSSAASSVANYVLSLQSARSIIEVNQDLSGLKGDARTEVNTAGQLTSDDPNRNDVIEVANNLVTAITTLKEQVKSVRKYTYHVANNRTVLEKPQASFPRYDRLGNTRTSGVTADAGAYEAVE